MSKNKKYLRGQWLLRGFVTVLVLINTPSYAIGPDKTHVQNTILQPVNPPANAQGRGEWVWIRDYLGRGKGRWVWKVAAANDVATITTIANALLILGL